MLALLALYTLGGAVIADFSIALIWGVLVGTYSSIFIAAPLLINLRLRSSSKAPKDDVDELNDSS